MIKLSDIAREMNVSTATISNALTGKGRMKEETRRLIREKAQAMGYVLPVPTVRSNLLLVLTEMNLITFTGEILGGLTAAAYESGISCAILDLNILQTGLNRDATPEQLRPRIDAALDEFGILPSCIVYISQYPRSLPKLLIDLPCPTIAISCWDTGAQVTVNYDDQQGAHAAVSRLIEQGCKSIMMLSGPVDNYAVSERVIGYQRALIEHGFPYHPKLVWIGDWEVPSGYTLTKNLLSSATPPDAVFSQNDSMAVGAIHAIQEAGLRIPDDISVIGFDDTPFTSWMVPTLSSVAPPFHEMGRTALQSAKGFMEGKGKEEILSIPCAVKLRQSTKG